MKILQVIPAFYPSKGYGGGPIVAYDISKRLVAMGNEVTVLTTDANDMNSKLENGIKDIDGIKVYYSKNLNNSLAYKYKIFLNPGLISWAKKEVKNFDIIHLHDTRTFQNLIIGYYAKKYNKSYIIQPHGTLMSFSTKKRIKFCVDFLFLKDLIRFAKHNFALTHNEMEQMIKYGVDKSRISIIPNGVDLTTFEILPEKNRFKKKFNIPEDKKIILFLGRIHKVKGLELLFDTFSILNKLDERLILVIAGQDDGALSKLQKKIQILNISAKVIFPGPVFLSDKLDLYADSEIFVLPSIYETFPVAALEAIASKLPVLIADTCEFSNEINNKVGLKFSREPKELSDKILQLINDKSLRKRFIFNSTTFIKKYDWTKIIREIEEVYLSVLGE